MTVLHTQDDWHLIRSGKDGYCGYLRNDTLGPPTPPTHRVAIRSTHAYARDDIKSPDQLGLSFGSHITALSETTTFVETTVGFIPRQALHHSGDSATDPAAVAEMFLGTPYLWGGNSAEGIDCSGLVQAACRACNLPCPGDSDQQAEHLGQHLPQGTSYQRNDVLFWKGHVALVFDPDTILHANAGHMAVVKEPIVAAISRIANQGDGPIIAHRRL